MIHDYRIHYIQIAAALPDRPGEKTLDVRAYTADDALTQAIVELDRLTRGARMAFSMDHPIFEITKIEPIEKGASDGQKENRSES